MSDFRSTSAHAERQSFRRAVDKSGLDHSRIAVLKKLGNLWFHHRFAAKEIRPGAGYLAKACKLSERTIRRILKEFRELGFIIATALEKGGCGATRYIVDMARVFRHVSGVQVVAGDLAEIVPDDRDEPVYDDNGVPIVDACDMAPSSDDAGQYFDEKSTFCSQNVTQLRPANLADGILAVSPISWPSGWNASSILRRASSLISNPYLCAKEGWLCEN